ncbi:lysozyme inhibitor LprI family protein [Vibrio coralliilyticus]|uniref:lysozyme inhibitor LprI family protein n=1 Tax=Vibrio coralliilyticus TaxID=190893 RepID=UPI0015601778|nr:lysozyme inhibitor LprI family protein [Vibrio coralliilyticus]NRF29831.1 DUF1311 domain-containing protein [Vibrio coralliilyticus]
MNLRSIFFWLILLIPTTSLAIESKCYELTNQFDVDRCIVNENKKFKEQYDKYYSHLIELKIPVEHRDKIVESEESWLKQLNKDCENYAYYADENSDTNEILKLECRTEMYNHRTIFIKYLINMAESF